MRFPVRRLLALVTFAVAAASSALVSPGASSTASGATTPGSPVAGTACRVFPSNNFWHADVRALPRHPRSAQWMSRMSPTRLLHPDFGPSYGAGPDYGIPVTVVDGSHPKVPVSFEYDDESDRGPYPLGDDTRIEGGRDSGGDMHAIVVDRSTCRLYETFYTSESNGSWEAGSGAIWGLRSNLLRPAGWTSADAAGLPILPGLLRHNEVEAGHVDHAIRFTTNVTRRAHNWPARHDAGSTEDATYPPMGARFRLKASFSTAGYGRDARVVIAAMKKHGLVLADNGSPWFFQGEQHSAWPEGLIEDLKRIPAGQFEAVNVAPLIADPNTARVR